MTPIPLVLVAATMMVKRDIDDRVTLIDASVSSRQVAPEFAHICECVRRQEKKSGNSLNTNATKRCIKTCRNNTTKQGETNDKMRGKADGC